MQEVSSVLQSKAAADDFEAHLMWLPKGSSANLASSSSTSAVGMPMIVRHWISAANTKPSMMVQPNSPAQTCITVTKDNHHLLRSPSEGTCTYERASLVGKL
jgi:hypothetical protein